MSYDSRTPNGCRPLGVTRSRAPQGGEPTLGVSHVNLQRFANDLTSLGRFFNEFPVRFKNQSDGFLKIRASFLKRGALRIRAWQLLNEANVPLGNLLEYRRQL